MAANSCIQCRVTPQTKSRLRVVAQEHQLTESALLKRLVETVLLQAAGASAVGLSGPIDSVSRGARLRPTASGRLWLLRERARGRGLAAATYTSFLMRAHLRAVAPIPRTGAGRAQALGGEGRDLLCDAGPSDVTGTRLPELPIRPAG